MTQKQTVSINFSQGLDLKTDPWQVPVGKFLTLQNSVFQKGGRLSKRNGYALLTAQNPSSSYITTLNNNLVSIGNTVNAYSSSLNEWITKGTLQPCSLNVLPLIRNNLNQSQSDSVVANGLVLTTYTQVNTTTSATVTSYLYAIADVITGQNIAPPSAIPVLTSGTISGSSRVFLVGNYFVIVSPVTVSDSVFLQYVSIPIINPVNISTNVPNVSAAQNVHSEVYIPITGNPGWDGVVTDNTLVVAYNTTAGGQGVHITSLTQAQIASNSASATVLAYTNAAYIASILTICVDTTVSPSFFYVSFWNNSTTNGYTASFYIGFGTITNRFSPVQIITGSPVANLASAAQNNSCLVFSEVTNAYSYDSAVPTNFINAVTISSVGTVGTPYVAIRSVGLASKAFIVSGKVYFLSAFQSPFQPSYFLINGSTTTSASPIIVAKLAYENGGGYLTLGLPNVSLSESTAQISYLYKDSVQALNSVNNPQQTSTGGIYSQLGVNLVSFIIGTKAIDSEEIGNTLNISGGYLSMFDGYLPVEQNFFVWPDSVEVVYTAVSTVTPTGTFLINSKTITVSSATGISPGMTITDTTNSAYIPNGTVVVTVSGTTLTISQATTHAGTTDALSIQGNIQAVPSGGTAGLGAYYYQATYEWTDNQGIPHRSSPSIPVPVTTTGSGTTGSIRINVPTLRLTSKVSNPVKIVIYRWSEFTQVYNQVTSIIAPVVNDTTIDQVSFVDNLPDSNITTGTQTGLQGIVGNNLIYTTGGVVPDVNAPSSDIMTLFDTRLWLVDNEDRNTLWVSKQVIEGTPVEMSSFFTIYVAPNIGTTSSTGPITAIAPMDDKLIIFKKNAIYYINGVGPNNLGTTAVGCSLGNYSQPIFVTSVVGCTNQPSIVLTQDGLMFQSDKGVWLLGRNLQTTYVGAAVENFNTSIVNSANVIPETNHVLFTLNTGEELMYDYYFQQWGTFIGAPAISSCIYNGLHTILSPFGSIFQQTPNTYLDGSNPVLMKFTTSWLNLASLQGYERFYNFLILAEYLSPHFLNCQVSYDYNPSIVHHVLISPDNFSSSTPSPYGVPVPFGAPASREQWKIDAKVQLCQSFQLSINEVFNPAFNTTAGAGFTMSGMAVQVGVKSSTRPIRGANSGALS